MPTFIFNLNKDYLTMRKFLFASSALAVLAFAGAAAAQDQGNNNPVTATININNIDVDDLAEIAVQGVGNSIGVTGPSIGANLFGGADSQRNNAAVNAIVNVNASDFGDDAEIGSTAVGNTTSIDVGGNVLLNGAVVVGAGGSNVMIGAGQINNAAVNAFTNVDGTDFDDDADLSSTAIANNLSATSTWGGVSVTTGSFGQLNNSTVTSELEVSNTDIGSALSAVFGANDSLTGGSTSVGNNLSIASPTSGSLSQQNFGAITATVDIDNVNSYGEDNALTSLAVGNSISLTSFSGSVAMFDQPSQDNGASVTANLTIDNSGFGSGDFASQAVGNLMTVGQAPGVGALRQDLDAGSVTSNLSVDSSAFWGDAGFSSLAIGNQMSLTGTPNSGYISQEVYAPVTANATFSNVTSLFNADVDISTTAAGNVLNMTSGTSNIWQSNNRPINALTTISNSTFGGNLNVGTVSIGNSLNITAP